MLIARSARAKKRMGLGLESKAGRLKEKCKLLLNGGNESAVIASSMSSMRAHGEFADHCVAPLFGGIE